jgi:hypothetical protein
MAIDYTSTELLNDVKQRAGVPTTQNLFTESKFVRFLANKIISDLQPLIMSAREDFFVERQDTTITAATEATNKYPIPSRAIGMKLKDVKLVDPNDDENETDLPHLNSIDRSARSVGRYNSLFGHWIEANNVRLFLKGSYTGHKLRLYYFRRPNRLVPTNEAGKITAINTGTNVVTLDNAPSSWTASTTFDVIEGKPGFKSLQDDQTITLISGFDLTFSSLPTDMVVGDYVAESGESPIPQIPYDAFPLLSQIGAIKVLGALTDKSGVELALEDFARMRKDFLTLVSPRVDDKPRKAVSRSGLWRSGPRRW